jgi:peptidoglycan/xylan/chitin deacetylase (PgdA/CDA1 family)
MNRYLNYFFYFISQEWMISFFKKKSILPYYHVVSDDYLYHINELYPFKSTTQFEKDLDFYQKYYKEIAPENLLNSKENVNKFLISFDDGFKEVYTVIYPILKRRGIKAIFFINPNFVDNKKGFYKNHISLIISKLKKQKTDIETLNKIADVFNLTYINDSQLYADLKKIQYKDIDKLENIYKILNIDIDAFLETQQPYLTKSQIKEMISDGYYFGGHTMNHVPLWQLTLEEQKIEIIESIEWLKNNFNITYSYFAFPFTDEKISTKLLSELFLYDKNLLVFGISDFKEDVDKRFIHRIPTEYPKRKIAKEIVSKNLINIYNILKKSNKIKRDETY